MSNNSTALDKYPDIGYTPFDFVLEESDPPRFNEDFISYPEEHYVIGDTIFICPSELSVIPMNTHPQVRFHTQGLERIKERQPSVIHRAMELRAVIGDPLTELERILQDISMEDDVWDQIAQEPYG
jgi:hypothetical protein